MSFVLLNKFKITIIILFKTVPIILFLFKIRIRIQKNLAKLQRPKIKKMCKRKSEKLFNFNTCKLFKQEFNDVINLIKKSKIL